MTERITRKQVEGMLERLNNDYELLGVKSKVTIQGSISGLTIHEGNDQGGIHNYILGGLTKSECYTHLNAMCRAVEMVLWDKNK